MVTEAERKVEAARAAWDTACSKWSRDDGADLTKTVLVGERLLYAATNLICALEDVVDERAGR